jgi:hypothetical protein
MRGRRRRRRVADGPADGLRRSREEHDGLDRPVRAEERPGFGPGVPHELGIAPGDVPADEDEAPEAPGVAEVFRGGS